LLLAGTLVLFWLSFSFAFSRSLELKRQLQIIEEQLMIVQDAPQKLSLLNERLARYEQIINNMAGHDASPLLIGKIGSFCRDHQVILMEIPVKVQYQKEEFTVSTYQVIVQGSFKKLIQLLNELEQNYDVGKLRAVSFRSEFNLKKGKKELIGNYYLQTISKGKQK